MVVTGKPDLAPFSGVQFRIVPVQFPDGLRPASLGRADEWRHRSSLQTRKPSSSAGSAAKLWSLACRAATGEAARQRTNTNHAGFDSGRDATPSVWLIFCD